MKISDNKKTYWGSETFDRPKLIETGHLMVTDPPYLQGSGLRIRFFGRVLSVGRIGGVFARILPVDVSQIREYQQSDYMEQKRLYDRIMLYCSQTQVWWDERDV